MASEPNRVKPDTVIRGIVRGGGSVWPFFSTSFNASERDCPSLHRDLLIEPFRSTVGDDGMARMCCLAGADDWERATQVIEGQLKRFGGPGVRQNGMGAGVEIGPNVKVHARKRIICSRAGKWKPPASSLSSSSFSSTGGAPSSTTTNLPKQHRHCSQKVSR